jgi:hypothetical protein
MNSTLPVRALLALSLVANIALGWMLWQQREHPEQLAQQPVQYATTSDSPTKALPAPAPPEPASVVDSAIPRAPRIEPPLPPLTRGGKSNTKTEALLFSSPESRSGSDPSKAPAYLRLEPPQRKDYGPPPPPNPYAFPPWEERLPYREDQLERGLYSIPRLKLDK